MPGFEVAGVVLGVIPLIISALEDYKAGKGVASSLVKWRGHLDTLIFRLKLQRTLFYLQAMELLREAGVSEIADAVDITEEDCVKLLRDATTGKEVEEYLGYLYPTFLEIVGRYERCLKTIAGKLGHIKRPPQAKKDDLRAIMEANTLPDDGLALKARLTFTIERGSLRDLVDEMQDDRLSLKAIIRGMKTQQKYESSEPSHDARKLAKAFLDIQKQAKSLYAAVCNGCTCQCQNAHNVMIHLDSRVPSRIDKPKKLKKQREPTFFDMFFQVGRDSWQETLVHAVENEGDENPTENPSRKATYPPIAKAVPTVTFTLSSDASHSRVLHRVTDICHSMRLAQSKKQILALRLAADVLELDAEPGKPLVEYSTSTTLEKFFHDTIQDEDSRMTPKQQTLLALNIASSILQLHGTHWLMKPWDKRVIRFLVQQTLTSKIEIGRPLVQNPIERQYQSIAHDAPQTDPKAALLELAILLLEIWHHRPLEHWMAKTGTHSADTPETRRIAAIKWVEMSSERLPPNHLTAIEGCLAICSGRLRKWDEDDFRKQYCENIIRPLQENCKAW